MKVGCGLQETQREKNRKHSEFGKKLTSGVQVRKLLTLKRKEDETKMEKLKRRGYRASILMSKPILRSCISFTGGFFHDVRHRIMWRSRKGLITFRRYFSLPSKENFTTPG